MKVKTIKQCIAFYYTWKKVCPDQYRHLKWMRRRRDLPEALQQPNAYNLRSCYDTVAGDSSSKGSDSSRVQQQSNVLPVANNSNGGNQLTADEKDIRMQNEIETILNIISANSDEKPSEVTGML